MSELIKREDAIKATWHEPSYIDPYNVLTEVRDRIEALPTVDAVTVCRCKDCKYNIGEKVWLDGDVTIDCANGMGYPPPNWYCADGERKDGEHEEYHTI